MTTTISGTAYITGDFLLTHATSGGGALGTFIYSQPEFVPADGAVYQSGGADVVWTGHRWIGVVGGHSEGSGPRPNANVLISASGQANTWTISNTLTTITGVSVMGISGIAADGTGNVIIACGGRTASSAGSTWFLSSDDGNTWNESPDGQYFGGRGVTVLNFYANVFMAIGACASPSRTQFVSKEPVSNNFYSFQTITSPSKAINSFAWNLDGNAQQLLAVAGGFVNPYSTAEGVTASSDYYYSNDLGSSWTAGSGFSGGFQGRSVVYAWGNYWAAPAPGSTTVRTCDPDTDIDTWTEISLPFTIAGPSNGPTTIVYDADEDIVIIPSQLTSGNNAYGYSYADSANIATNTWSFWPSNTVPGTTQIETGSMCIRTGNGQLLNVAPGSYEYS